MRNAVRLLRLSRKVNLPVIRTAVLRESVEKGCEHTSTVVLVRLRTPCTIAYKSFVGGTPKGGPAPEPRRPSWPPSDASTTG